MSIYNRCKIDVSLSLLNLAIILCTCREILKNLNIIVIIIIINIKYYDVLSYVVTYSICPSFHVPF